MRGRQPGVALPLGALTPCAVGLWPALVLDVSRKGPAGGSHQLFPRGCLAGQWTSRELGQWGCCSPLLACRVGAWKRPVPGHPVEGSHH